MTGVLVYPNLPAVVGQLAEQVGDENLAMRALMVAALVHTGRGEVTEASQCLNKVIQVAADASDGELQRRAMVALVNLASSATGDNAAAAVQALSNYRQLVPRLSACGVCGELAERHVMLMPCCEVAVHRACGAAVAEDGVCPACTRHVCGRRYVGLAACQRCLAPPPP
jgi:hypothetical protein